MAYGTIVGSYIDEDGRAIDHHVGAYLVRDEQSTLYKVTYDVHMLGGNVIINLDQQRGLRGVQCDISSIELTTIFNNGGDAMSFYRVITGSSADRFVTGTNWNCKNTQDGEIMLMRRVLGATINGNTVVLKTVEGHYEESIKDGTIKLDKADLPQDHSNTFCLGVNSNKDCTEAAAPIPIYSNKYMDITCGNCFVGAKATVFLDVEISWFKLKRIATGLKDININAAFVLNLDAKVNWAAGYDKTYRLVDKGIILQFWIGPIPISIWYEIPVQLLAEAKVDAQVALAAGAKANWKVGDAYFEWNDSEGWHMVRPHPVFTWEPVLKAEGNFNAAASLAIIPSFVIHAMRIIQAGVKMTPKLMLEANGDLQKKQVCADLSYQVNSEANAEVHINIPLFRISYDWLDVEVQ